jgi:RNA polymerase sigma-70 factor (ECF subfamily)
VIENPSNSIEETELIAKAQKGDRKSLSDLVKMYESTIFNFAFKICRNHERAEHVVQETFLSMVKSISQFSGNSKLSTWLYTVVSNHCLMLARGEKRRERTFLNEDLSDSPHYTPTDWKNHPDEIAENEELRIALDKAISKLPEDYKIVFMLRDVEGFSTKETADIVELTIPAIKSRLHRARAFLRDELNKIFSDENKKNYL